MEIIRIFVPFKYVESSENQVKIVFEKAITYGRVHGKLRKMVALTFLFEVNIIVIRFPIYFLNVETMNAL